MERALTAIFALAMIATAIGCTRVPVYQQFNGRHGYSDAPVEPNLYEVGFTGTARMSLTRARYLATLRGAELAAVKNIPHIEVEERDMILMPRSRYVAGSTSVRTTSWRDRRGRDQHSTSVTSWPGRVHYFEIPFVRLFVRMLDEPTDASLDVLEILHDGRSRGIEFSAPVEALLSPDFEYAARLGE